MRAIGIVFLLFCCNSLFGQTLEEFVGDSKVIGIGYYSGFDKNSGLFHQEVLSLIDEKDSVQYLFDLDISHDILLYLKDTVVNYETVNSVLDDELDSTYIEFLVSLLKLCNKGGVEVLGEIGLLSAENFEFHAKRSNNIGLVNFLELYRQVKNSPDSIVNLFEEYSNKLSLIGMSEFEFVIFKSVMYRSAFKVVGTELNDFAMCNFDRIFLISDNLTLKESIQTDGFLFEKKIYLVSDVIRFSSEKDRKFKCNLLNQKMTLFLEKKCLKVALNYLEGCRKYSFEPNELIYFLE